MEAYNERNEQNFEKFEKTKNFLSSWFGVGLTLFLLIVVFVIASLEGEKEVKASNSDSGKLLNIWREKEGLEEGFPEEKSTIITYKNKEYYFVIDEIEDGQIISWYWAYDAGINYIFQDYKYYVLVGITIVFSIIVSNVNYNSTVEKATNTRSFKKTLLYYQEQKDMVRPYTQYISSFCLYKIKKARREAKEKIVSRAEIDFDFYESEKFDKDFEKTLPKWQRKILKEIRKIKVENIDASDLLQEQNFSSKMIRFLPEGQDENKKKFVKKGVFGKILTTFLSGLVAGFGISVGNWPLGLLFAGSIIASAIGAVISGAEYGAYTLRNRFIGKANLLIEFFNIKEQFFEKEERPQDVVGDVLKKDIDKV
jgi:hypothetical protein